MEKVDLEKPGEKLTRHLRPLYVKTHIEGHLVNKVLAETVRQSTYWEG